MAERSAESVKALIHKTASGGSDEPIEYEADSYGNMDDIDEDDVAGLEEMPEEEEAPAEETAAPSVDWEAIARQQQEELAAFKAEQAERAKVDLKRRVEELPEEERVPFLLNYQEEQERAAQIETIRKEQSVQYPLGAMVFGKVAQYFDVELDDPESYKTALAGMNSEFTDLFSELLEVRVKQEMEKFYAETGQEWGTKKLGDAQPRGLQPRNPVRSQYELTRKEMAKPGTVKTVDDLAKLVRQRQMAK
jgi:hypothetical protein